MFPLRKDRGGLQKPRTKTIFNNQSENNMLEQKVTIFDPVVGAFRQVPLDIAERYVETLEDTKKAVKKARQEADDAEALKKLRKK